MRIDINIIIFCYQNIMYSQTGIYNHNIIQITLSTMATLIKIKQQVNHCKKDQLCIFFRFCPTFVWLVFTCLTVRLKNHKSHDIKNSESCRRMAFMHTLVELVFAGYMETCMPSFSVTGLQDFQLFLTVEDQAQVL